MKICTDHWQLMKVAISDRGMEGLIAKSGEAAFENTMAELHGEADPKKTFDPLMSMHWHFSNDALRCGGLYIMGVDEADPDRKANAGHYCPICEFVKNSEGFKADEAIGNVADQMATWCRSEGLIPEKS